MDEKILQILRVHKDNFISSDQLCQKINISQPALTRQIHQLRDVGYDIQCQPHLGYRLIGLPDRLLPQEISFGLHTKIIGRKILSFNSVDSTNDIAFALAQQGEAFGTCVFAETQRKGKGRLGRSWLSPKAKGIYLSLILRPDIPPQQAPLITLLAAVAVSEAIRKVCRLQALIRWPNDILVNNKKVCGILTQMQVENNTPRFVILGIGINVNTAISKLPVGASSLKTEARAKVNFSRINLTCELLHSLERHYQALVREGSAGILRQWRNFSALSGQRIRVGLVGKTIEGLAQDIDEQGALIVRLDNGFKMHLSAGDVVRVL